jgi:cytochrome c-type biogenesis protein CcsB
MKTLLKTLPWFFVWLFAVEIVAVMMPKKDGEFHVREFGRLPVLLNGRIQPFDSVARNSLLQLRSTGDVPLEEVPSWKFWHHPKKLKATEWLLEAMTRPEIADTRPIFLIHYSELLGELKLQDKGVEHSGLRYYTFEELMPAIPDVGKQADRIMQREKEKLSKPEQRTVFEKQLMKLYNAVVLYQQLKYTLQPEDSHDFSQELVDFQKALGPARAAARAEQAGQDYDKDAIQRMAEPLQRFRMMANYGYALTVPPIDPEKGRDRWQNTGTSVLELARENECHPALTNLAAIATAYHLHKPDEFNNAVTAYRKWLEPKFEKELRKGRAEFYYNDVKAFLHATIIYIFALLLAGGGLLTYGMAPNLSESLRRSAFYLVALAGVVHTFGLVFRMILEGRPPVTNLYSSAIFIGWGTMVLGLVLERIYRVGIGSLVASLAGFITLLIAHNLALGGDTMEMLRAVLDTNFWLATHVVVVTLGYASTFVAGMLGVIYIVLGVFTPMLTQKLAPQAGTVTTGPGSKANRAAGNGAPKAAASPVEIGKALAKMAYGIVCFATLFSFTGTVLGGIWADQSWGRFWGWDPKENGALLIVIWNAIILHARWGGLVRERGIMNLAVFGNIVTSFSWFGVNMLGIGLHSYGFMDAAFKWLMMFVCSQAMIISLGLLPLRVWRSFREQRTVVPGPASLPSGATAKAAPASP